MKAARYGLLDTGCQQQRGCLRHTVGYWPQAIGYQIQAVSCKRSLSLTVSTNQTYKNTRRSELKVRTTTPLITVSVYQDIRWFAANISHLNHIISPHNGSCKILFVLMLVT